jgi:Flp pilus assembly protein TadD
MVFVGKNIDKILAINPKNITALTNKGISLNYLGNHTGAILYYDKTLAIDPKNVRALNDKGISLNYW